MNASALLIEQFGRIKQHVREAVEGLNEEQLASRIDSEANSVSWLIWHIARVEDAQIADAAGLKQLWDQGWREKFSLEPPIGRDDTGYGHSAEQVAAVKTRVELLTGYYEAVSQQTKKFLQTVTDNDLDKIIDQNWNPPVTLGVRLSSILVDVAQHVGQANYIRGVILRQASH